MGCSGRAAEPLRWPRSLKAPTRLQAFLMGMPLVGADKRVLRDWRRQVAARPDTWQGEWPQGQEVRRARDALARIIMREMEWPQGRFAPGDPLSILLFDPTISLLAVGALEDIEALLKRELTVEEVSLLTFGDLVQMVLAAEGPNALAGGGADEACA